jgi:hypothetical protein
MNESLESKTRRRSILIRLENLRNSYVTGTSEDDMIMGFITTHIRRIESCEKNLDLVIKMLIEDCKLYRENNRAFESLFIAADEICNILITYFEDNSLKDPPRRSRHLVIFP